MTRSRSTLWPSLALLLSGSILLLSDVLVYEGSTPVSAYDDARQAPLASSSASLIDPEAVGDGGTNALDNDAPQQIDVRGNEIARPLARYRVDDRGSLYEVHSPETEMSRLKAPLM